MTQPNNKDGAS